MSGLDALFATIAARRGADPESSWTARLFAKGPEKCAEKFGEEAVEAIIEAVKGDRAKLTSEAADVIYHLLVMLAARDVALGDVVAELDRRSGRSGLDEKAARAAVPPIGPAAPDDRDGIAALYAEALPDEDLGALLEDLHGFGSGGVLELVARDTAGRVAGHCGFTLCGLGTRGATAALLGPLAVTPDRQRAGIGRALVQAGLERLGRAGVAHLLVLGDPAYYGRLGFAPATAVAPPYALPGDLADAWQVRTLDPAAPPPEGALAVPAPWRRAALWQP